MAKKKTTKGKGAAAKTIPHNAKSVSITDSINTEIIAQVLSVGNQAVLLKLCRLCEAKDGPFFNIFEADKVIAKKIDDLMPFGIEENDELPHKICFRCSAKVEELYEFVQKCVRTQESLRKAIGKMGTLSTKTKTRTLWEEKLNKSNMSNDDICNALIKKAMEGIKDIPLNPVPSEKPVSKKELKNDILEEDKVLNEPDKKKIDQETTSTNPIKVQPEKMDQKILNTRSTRMSNLTEPISEGLRSKNSTQTGSDYHDNDSDMSDESERRISKKSASKPDNLTQVEVKKKEEKPADENKSVKKSFDIMDHVSMIKVNGVGVLFQCKLCNRNFLKKDVVLSHSCAKNGHPKQEVIPDYLPPSPPKGPVIKYINTKTDSLHSKPAIINDKPIILDDEPIPPAPTKIKVKAGPASRVKRYNADTETNLSESNVQIKVCPNVSSQVQAPTVQFPNVPSLNSRYKLVSGPNNTFTLVEEKVAENMEIVSSDDSNSASSSKTDKGIKKDEGKSKQSENLASSKKNKAHSVLRQEKATDERDTLANKPYPVGLIKKVGHHSNNYTPPTSESVSFTTPAMKKQSYSIVQTGNPSKLLISTKPQPAPEEVPKKRTKRMRPEIMDRASEQPFSVTLEDVSPPKDPGFFTFINVDPLLQPSYVLPTDNIIQESQISTSTPINSNQAIENKEKEKDNKYTCNMCSEQFSREKKLLSHIHSHYNKMDEEDQLREKTKKRLRKH